MKVKEESDTSSVVHNITQSSAPDPNQLAVTTAASALSNIGGSLATNLGTILIRFMNVTNPFNVFSH